MTDIAENKSSSSRSEIISKHVTETKKGLVKRLRGRGINRKRNASARSRKEEN
jgi:hypothetical protein